MAGASISPLAGGPLVERLARCLTHRGAPGKGLPASQDDFDISRAELETVAQAAGHFGRNQAVARAEKRIVDQLAGPAVVDNRAAHSLDRLLRAVPPTLLAPRAAERMLLGNSQTVVWVRSPCQWLVLPSRTAYQQHSCFQW
jgi:hypothetical protein